MTATSLSQVRPATPLSIRRHFARLRDPRLNRRKRHQLLALLVIALCAVVAGANNWQQIAAFGKRRCDWLGKFLALPNGIPSHDTFERVFQRLCPDAFQRCFLARACRSRNRASVLYSAWSMTQ